MEQLEQLKALSARARTAFQLGQFKEASRFLTEARAVCPEHDLVQCGDGGIGFRTWREVPNGLPEAQISPVDK